MLNLNKVVVAGNLGADPETHFFEDGSPVCTYRVGTTERYKDKNGELREHTEWVMIQSFGRRAAVDQQYLKKGSGVYIEGRLRTRKWVDKDTKQDRYAVSIHAQVVQFTGPKPKDAPADQYEAGEGGEYGYSDAQS